MPREHDLPYPALHLVAGAVQIVAMSATISNLAQLGNFLGAQLYTGSFRPVELRQYVKVRAVGSVSRCVL